MFLGEVQDFTPCETMNPHSKCAQYACHVEAHFLVQEWLYLRENQVDFQFFHENDFNQVSFCYGSNRMVLFEPVQNYKDCCGEYPNRTPYVIGDKDCCGNHVFYNMVNEECCWDGSVTSLGECL